MGRNLAHSCRYTFSLKERKMNVRKMIEAFHREENGLPESVYVETCKLIEATLGEKARQAFTFIVDATDGMFYIHEGLEDPYGFVLVAANDWDVQTDNSGQMVIHTGQDTSGMPPEN